MTTSKKTLLPRATLVHYPCAMCRLIARTQRNTHRCAHIKKPFIYCCCCSRFTWFIVDESKFVLNNLFRWIILIKVLLFVAAALILVRADEFIFFYICAIYFFASKCKHARFYKKPLIKMTINWWTCHK